MKFARNVQFQIKKGKEKEFAGLFENEVLPVLRKQDGFEEEMTMVNRKGASAISLWTDRKSAETYQKATYPGILATLSTVIEGTPTVETYETAKTFSRVQ